MILTNINWDNIYTHVDINSCYTAFETVFQPWFRGLPLVALSNNDGCVIARNHLAKQLGIKMGIPEYQVKHVIEKYGVHKFSSNYELYGDMSTRTMALLSEFAPYMEIYSIDEAFLYFKRLRENLISYGDEIAYKIRKGIGVTIGVGIAPSKALAKMANKLAKRYLYLDWSNISYTEKELWKSLEITENQVCVIDNEDKLVAGLKLTDVSDLWGVGKKYTTLLRNNGIYTAFDLIQKYVKWVQKKMTITGVRLQTELKGIPCFTIETMPPPKKSLTTSRSFGQPLTDYTAISEAVANYASICAQKLRQQGSCVTAIMTFLHTNGFQKHLPQYAANKVTTLPVPINSTSQILKYVLSDLKDIYEEEYKFHKGGVIFMGTVPQTAIQGNVYHTGDSNKDIKLSGIMDKYNSGFRQILTLGSQGNQNSKKIWGRKQDYISDCYTTKLDDLPTVYF